MDGKAVFPENYRYENMQVIRAAVINDATGAYFNDFAFSILRIKKNRIWETVQRKQLPPSRVGLSTSNLQVLRRALRRYRLHIK